MIAFFTLEDISNPGGGGVATAELLVALGRQSSGRLVVCCPEPSAPVPARVRVQVDQFRYLPSADGSGRPLWHLRTELRILRHLCAMVRDGPPNLVVTRLAPSTLSPAPFCQRYGIPHVLLVRGWVTRDRAGGQWPLAPLVERLLRMNVRRSTEVYVAFGELRARVAGYRGPEQTPVRVLPNAVDPALFDGESPKSRASIGLPEDAFAVGFVGTFSERHQLPTLIRAAARHDGIHILLVGDGPLRADLEVLAEAQGLEDRVTFTGQVPHEDVPGYIAACDVGYGVVDPDRPSNPIKCYEYLACGTPVVTSEKSEFRFVDDRDAGVTLADVTLEAIADALGTLRDRGPDERQAMGERGRQYVLEHHTWDRVAETILETSGTVSRS